MPTVSIVIPCFNSARYIEETVAGIASCAVPPDITLQVILVDDASTDSTWDTVRKLVSADGPVQCGMRMTENQGPYHAIIPGMQAATGDAVVVMAADGDDPPSLLPQMIALWQQGHPLVQAVRNRTPRPMARVFYRMMRLLGTRNLPPNGCDLMLADRRIVDRAMAEGFRPGHTLIQLYQHADSAAILPYDKGSIGSGGWTLWRKTVLFTDTILATLRLSRTIRELPVAEKLFRSFR